MNETNSRRNFMISAGAALAGVAFTPELTRAAPPSPTTAAPPPPPGPPIPDPLPPLTGVSAAVTPLPGGGKIRLPEPVAVMDYGRNPFLRPIGYPHKGPPLPTPPTRSGSGIV